MRVLRTCWKTLSLPCFVNYVESYCVPRDGFGGEWGGDDQRKPCLGRGGWRKGHCQGQAMWFEVLNLPPLAVFRTLGGRACLGAARRGQLVRHIRLCSLWETDEWDPGVWQGQQVGGESKSPGRGETEQGQWGCAETVLAARCLATPTRS